MFESNLMSQPANQSLNETEGKRDTFSYLLIVTNISIPQKGI